MSHNTISGRSRLGWWIAATAVPAAALAGGSDWPVVAVASAGCALAVAAVVKFRDGEKNQSAWFAIAQTLWLGYIAGKMAGYSKCFWPDGQAEDVVPVTLLVLGCTLAEKGAERTEKVGAILAWVAAPVISIVLLAGAGDIKGIWLQPGWKLCEPMVITVLLVPCLSVYMQKGDKTGHTVASLITGAAGVIAAIWIRGSVPLEMLENTNPLLEYSKGITLAGTAKRLESICSCAVTVGWFGLLSLLLGTAGRIAECVAKGWGKKAVCLCGMLAVIVAVTANEQATIVEPLGCTVFWILIPLLAGSGKKMKKVEKGY